jgi:uncharacterized membrane protein YidH (DUF202 family)
MPSAADNRPRDPGLAVERTVLAWQRIATGFTTLGAVTIGAAAHRDQPWMVAPAVALLLVAVAVYGHGRRRGAGGPPERRALGAVAAAVVATAVLAAALAVAAVV